MDKKKIIGIMLVKNEEYFAALALQSILGFCDEIIILDNMSKDSTAQQLEQIATSHPQVIYRKFWISAPHTSRSKSTREPTVGFLG